ncbi:MAG TPA: hypothetical protein VK633_15115 [Verrucomicrobiae bacterium]|nr:hypothetical protein [Verrucomicrobiae bacterium]
MLREEHQRLTAMNFPAGEQLVLEGAYGSAPSSDFPFNKSGNLF